MRLLHRFILKIRENKMHLKDLEKFKSIKGGDGSNWALPQSCSRVREGALYLHCDLAQVVSAQIRFSLPGQHPSMVQHVMSFLQDHLP